MKEETKKSVRGMLTRVENWVDVFFHMFFIGLTYAWWTAPVILGSVVFGPTLMKQMIFFALLATPVYFLGRLAYTGFEKLLTKLRGAKNDVPKQVPESA